MKNFKCLFCLLLALAMVFALAACGSTDEDTGSKRGSKKAEKEETLVGEWAGEIDMSEYLNVMMEEELGMDLGIEDFALVMYLTFEEDGTYEAEIDMDKMEDAMLDVVDAIWEAVIEMTAEQSGMSYSECEALMEQSGVTKDMLLEEMDLESAFGDIEDQLKGEWVLDGDELYMADEDPKDTDPVTIEFDGDEFSIVDGDFMDDEELAEYILPIVFERQ